MTTFVNRSAGLVLLALILAACGGATQASSAPSAPGVTASQSESPDASTAPSQSEPPDASTAPSRGEPSEGSAPSACLDAEVLAALEAYKDVEVPADPTFDEVADALEALDLGGNAAEFRAGVVEVLRDDTYTLDVDRLHDMMFSLLPLQSEVELV